MKMFIPKNFVPPRNPTYEDGYRQAIEDAAKVADDDEDGICTDDAYCRCSSRIATKIHALLPGGKAALGDFQ